MIKDIELSIKNKNFELTKKIFNDIYNKIDISFFSKIIINIYLKKFSFISGIRK